jgi:hypothetical protein
MEAWEGAGAEFEFCVDAEFCADAGALAANVEISAVANSNASRNCRPPTVAEKCPKNLSPGRPRTIVAPPTAFR